jgi:hypothetical protein
MSLDSILLKHQVSGTWILRILMLTCFSTTLSCIFKHKSIQIRRNLFGWRSILGSSISCLKMYANYLTELTVLFIQYSFTKKIKHKTLYFSQHNLFFLCRHFEIYVDYRIVTRTCQYILIYVGVFMQKNLHRNLRTCFCCWWWLFAFKVSSFLDLHINVSFSWHLEYNFWGAAVWRKLHSNN